MRERERVALSHEQWEERKNPAKYGDDEGENDEVKKATLNQKSHASSSAISVSPSAEILREEDDELASFSIGGARKSSSPQLPSPNPMSSSPVLLKRAEEEARAKWARDQNDKKAAALLEKREKELLKEVSTGGTVNVSNAILPPPKIRENREAYKRLATEHLTRTRPKSATGRSNGAKAALRLKRAQEFERLYGGPLTRPSTASKAS